MAFVDSSSVDDLTLRFLTTKREHSEKYRKYKEKKSSTKSSKRYLAFQVNLQDNAISETSSTQGESSIYTPSPVEPKEDESNLKKLNEELNGALLQNLQNQIEGSAKSMFGEALSEEEESLEIETEQLMQKAEEETFECFKLIDIDNDGKIDPEDVKIVMESLRKPITIEEAEEIIQSIDNEDVGFITYERFRLVMREIMMKGTEEEDLRHVFDFMNTDSDGFVSAKEMQLVYRSLGEMLTPDECLVYVEQFQTTQEGLFNFQDFEAYYQRTYNDYIPTMRLEKTVTKAVFNEINKESDGAFIPKIVGDKNIGIKRGFHTGSEKDVESQSSSRSFLRKDEAETTSD